MIEGSGVAKEATVAMEFVCYRARTGRSSAGGRASVEITGLESSQALGPVAPAGSDASPAQSLHEPS